MIKGPFLFLNFRLLHYAFDTVNDLIENAALTRSVFCH